MFNRGPNLLVHVLLSALGGAVALAAGIIQDPVLPPAPGGAEGARYAVDALSILIVAALVGDRRVKAEIKQFISEHPLVAPRHPSKSEGEN